jgi:hypothetical protein
VTRPVGRVLFGEESEPLSFFGGDLVGTASSAMHDHGVVWKISQTVGNPLSISPVATTTDDDSHHPFLIEM